MKRLAHQPVTMYRTLDGVVHGTEKDAQEHAEDLACRAISELLHAADPNMGHQVGHRIICHMLKNPVAYSKALEGLLAFPAEEETSD